VGALAGPMCSGGSVLRLRGGTSRRFLSLGVVLKLLNIMMAQMVLTSVGLFRACSSSLSGGQGDGPGLHARDLL